MEMMRCDGKECPLRFTCKRYDPLNELFNDAPMFSRPPFIKVDKIHIECDKYIDQNRTYSELMERMKKDV